MNKIVEVFYQYCGKKHLTPLFKLESYCIGSFYLQGEEAPGRNNKFKPLPSIEDIRNQ